MANILIVEDDEHMRMALRSTLESSKHKVTEAADGKVARDIIKASSGFDLILSDIQMPFLTGVELLEWVKANKPCPFILMTGFALIMETQKAHELGADDFLTKPFNVADLHKMLLRLSPTPAAEAKVDVESESDYCKVPISEFVATPKIVFDVFIKLGRRYVKVGNKGDDIPTERIQSYQEKGLKFLHIKKEDFRNLVSFSITVAKKINTTSAISQEKKAQFLRYTGELILEKAFITGVDQEAFDSTKEFLTTCVDVLAEEDDALNLMDQFNAHADYVYAHSLCVSMYATMIARSMGWQSTQQLFRLSLCGMFHDIGKKEIDRELLDKPRPQMTMSERKLFESHTTRGRDILMALRSMPSEVVRVAYEHHEDSLGSGYPMGIKKQQIHPFTQIIRVANLFAEFSLKTPSRQGMGPHAAIEYMKTHYVETLEPQAFAALGKLFTQKR